MANYKTSRNRFTIIISPTRNLAIYLHEVDKLGLDVVLGFLRRADFFSEELGEALKFWFDTQQYLLKSSLEKIKCRRRLKRLKEGNKCQH